MLTLLALALTPTPQDAPAVFAPPVKVFAADTQAGLRRMYPSPSLHDLDGDGLADLVVGDLPGRPTWAKRLPSEDGSLRFAAEARALGHDGQGLDFNNW